MNSLNWAADSWSVKSGDPLCVTSCNIAQTIASFFKSSVISFELTSFKTFLTKYATLKLWSTLCLTSDSLKSL